MHSKSLLKKAWAKEATKRAVGIKTGETKVKAVSYSDYPMTYDQE